MTTSSSPFFGRVRERERFKRALEQRSGAYLRFYGIGGIGKSALLRQLYADATSSGGNLPPITPYVVLLDLEQIATPVQFFDSLIASLEATGKTHRRRFFRREDTLAACRRLVAALAAQSAASARRNIDTRISAERGGRVGAVSVQNTIVEDKAAPPVMIEDVLRAFRQAIANDLPALVTVPPGTQAGYQPKRLLVLLCDSLDKTSQEVRNTLHDLWSGVLEERCILVCAGREEERRKAAQPLAQYELGALEPAAIAIWLARSQVDDPALRAAIVELCRGVPMMLALAIERVAAARTQGRSLSSADFRPPQSSHGGEIAREVVETFLVQGYLLQLEQGSGQDQQQARLISRGCILRRIEPQEVLSALGIVGRDDAGPLLHRLTERGFLAHRRMHEVIQRTARDLFRTDEPEFFDELLVKMERYYGQRSAAYEADVLYARLLRGDSMAARDLLASVGQRLQAGDLPGATQLIAAAQEAEPPEAARWYVELAKADLALAEGGTARAGERLLHLIDGAEGNQERVDLIRQRLRTIELPIHPQLAIWLIRHSPPDAQLLQSALTAARALRQQSNWPLATVAYTVAYEIAQAMEDPQGQAQALLGLGHVARLHDELVAATKHYHQALVLYQAVEDRLGQAKALRGLGEVAEQRDELAGASEHYRQALALYQAVEDRLGQAYALRGLGEVARQRGELEAAAVHYSEALALFRAVESRQGQAQALFGLGEVARQHDELEAATAHYSEALTLFQAVDYRQGQAQVLLGLGEVARLRSELAGATVHYHQALALCQAVVNRLGQAQVLLGLGEVAGQRGELEAAAVHYSEALALSQAIENRRGQAFALRGLGEVARQRGELEAAAAHYSEALALSQAVEDRLVQATALRGLGDVARQRGDLVEATEYYHRVLALHRAVESRQGQAQALFGLGAVAMSRSQLQDARNYAQEALRLSKAVEDLVGQYNSWDLLVQIATAEDNSTEAIYCRQEAQAIADELRSHR